MRILSYIDFYNQFSAFKGRKLKKKYLYFFLFFEKFYCQKWPTRTIPMTSAYQFQGTFLMAY